MLMDVTAVQGIADDLRDSAGTVNNAALRIADAVRGFETADAGRTYQSAGERLVTGLDELRRSLFAWANCVHDCGTALRAGADGYTETDQSTAVDLGAVPGALV
ncbi:hypothetical protein [Nocardia sp. X0981]